jgi:hypothetical protein
VNAMATVNTKVRLRPFYTASTWATLFDGLRGDLAKRTITNAEAVALVREWRDVAHSSGPLWYQFAATAYGFAPPKRVALVNTAKQAAATYPMKDALLRWMGGIATELDARGDGQPPRIAPNKDTFADPVFFGDVRAKVHEDGAAKLSPAPRPPSPVKRNEGSSGLVVLALLAWVLLTPNRRPRGK